MCFLPLPAVSCSTALRQRLSRHDVPPLQLLFTAVVPTGSVPVRAILQFLPFLQSCTWLVQLARACWLCLLSQSWLEGTAQLCGCCCTFTILSLNVRQLYLMMTVCCAGILAVEAYHAGGIRTLLIQQQDVMTPYGQCSCHPHVVVMFVNKILCSEVRSRHVMS